VRDWRRFTPILVLFLALRLMMLATFLPGDLTRFGDYPYYYSLARFSDDGHFPFIHYWSEYPPVFPFISIAIYRLALMVSSGSYETYVYLFGGLMVAFDTGSLYLFLRLARRLWGEEQALQLGWTYSVLFVPLIFCWWTFEGITAFFILLALYLLLDGVPSLSRSKFARPGSPDPSPNRGFGNPLGAILDLLSLSEEGRERGSAVAVGLGAMTKLVPLLILPAVVRTCPPRRWLPYILVVGVVMVAVAGPLLYLGGPYAVASFRSIVARSSYQTVWALIDGNLGTGLLGAATDHFDLAKATAPTGNPARIPEWLKTGLFGLLYLFIFLKANLNLNLKRLVSFVCLTLVIFLLWSKGWSPQWQVFLFPLILLSLPYRRALLFVLALSGISLAEWPVLLSRGLNEWLYLTVPLRTGLFVLLAVELWREVRPVGR
jgi:hypothetical protein